MAYTRHGYHIVDTNRGEGVTTAPAPTGCGGPAFCTECKDDLVEYEGFKIGTSDNYPERAKSLIRTYLEKNRVVIQKEEGINNPEEYPPYDVYVVWFTKTLKNWKAMISTTRSDGMFYEVTHNGEKSETYIDAYKKVDNIVVPDPPKTEG